MFQSCHVPVWPDVWLGHHFLAVPQGARAGHAAERRGQRRHRPRYRPPVRPRHYARAKRRPLHDGPAARLPPGSRRPAGHSAVLHTYHTVGAAGRSSGIGHAVCRADTAVAEDVHHAVHRCVWGGHHDSVCRLLCGDAGFGNVRV